MREKSSLAPEAGGSAHIETAGRSSGLLPPGFQTPGHLGLQGARGFVSVSSLPLRRTDGGGNQSFFSPSSHSSA